MKRKLGWTTLLIVWVLFLGTSVANAAIIIIKAKPNPVQLGSSDSNSTEPDSPDSDMDEDDLLTDTTPTHDGLGPGGSLPPGGSLRIDEPDLAPWRDIGNRGGQPTQTPDSPAPGIGTKQEALSLGGEYGGEYGDEVPYEEEGGCGGADPGQAAGLFFLALVGGLRGRGRNRYLNRG